MPRTCFFIYDCVCFCFRPNAKLLWKRIPANLKHENPELNAIWGIAKKLWQRDFASIYAALTEFEWPNHLRNVMNCIGGNSTVDFITF